jgi:group I intron endonuclease
MVYNMCMAIKSGIYQIVHIESGKCYVGQTINLNKRWTEHRWHLAQGSHHTSRLQRAWKKHGSSAFQFKILEECEPDRLTEREQWWMDTLRPVYNSSPAAGSIAGMKFGERSEETKVKQRAAWTPERRAALAARNKANPVTWSVESRAKASATHTGRPKPLTPKGRAVLVGRNKARTWRPSPETARKPTPETFTAETRAKIADANTQRMWTPEARARLGATQKARYAAMSRDERMAMTAGCRTEETSAKMSAAWTPERKAKFAAATRARAAKRSAEAS